MNYKLTAIRLQNFKCFKDHVVHFDNTTILIGSNNAGKSTVVEALRILGLCTFRLKSISEYRNAPIWTGLRLVTKGIFPSLKAIDVDLEAVFYMYGEPPAILTAIFDNSLYVNVYINNESELFACATLNDQPVNSRAKAIEFGIPNICVLPQIGPLRRKEKTYGEDTIKSNQFTRRISGNFRNQLLLNKNIENYLKFQEIVAETWNGIKIVELYVEEGVTYLTLRDRDFSTEIYHMGHGIQMWLQTMWFITWVNERDIIVLDEPDVYMHADLQRKLIRILKQRYGQIVIATHSIEILSEVEPSNVVVIDRYKDESAILNTYPAVQIALNGIGSIHNISISRLLNNKKYLYVEGKDMDILERVHNILLPNSKIPIDHIPCTTTGGWGSWEAQKTNAINLHGEIDNLEVYFVYDRDYHTDEEIEARKRDAASNNIHMTIWNMKEIENYMLIPSTVSRIIKDRNPSCESRSMENDVAIIIDQICEELKDDTLSNLIEEYKKRNKALEYKTCRNAVLPYFGRTWAESNGKTKIVSGKKVLCRLSDICKSKYGVSFGELHIASNLKKNEIPLEMVTFLQMLSR